MPKVLTRSAVHCLALRSSIIIDRSLLLHRHAGSAAPKKEGKKGRPAIRKKGRFAVELQYTSLHAFRHSTLKR